MWKNTVQPGRQQATIGSMRNACWITNATNTCSECVTPIPFPLQQWLQERAPILHFTYIACLLYLYSLFLKIICSTHDISKLSVASPYKGEPQTPYLHCLPLVRIARFLSGDVMLSRAAEAPDMGRSVTPKTPILHIHFRIFLKFQVDT
jgi:hypothetical protein